MRRDRRSRIFEAVVLVAAVAGTAILIWAALLAVQRRPVPVWVWVLVACLTIIGGGLTALDGGRHGAPDGAFRHSSGGLVIVHGYRERRRRGTRIALDWRYGLRGYLFVPTGLIFGVLGGVALLERRVWWQQIAGALIVIGAVVASGALIRWLLLPVDPESRARLEAYYEQMRWHWGGLSDRLKSFRSRRKVS